MTDLDRLMTNDDVLLINTVCGGMPLDFTTKFMTRIPKLLKIADSLGWEHDLTPEVELGDVEYFNVVLVCEDGNQRVIGSVGYLNHYELNIEDPEGYSGVELREDEDGDITTFYTGWAFSERDSYEEVDTWDFIESERVIAWKALPTYNGLKTP